MSKELPVNRKLGFYISTESGRDTVVSSSQENSTLNSGKKDISRVFRDVRKGQLDGDVVVHRLKSA